MIKAVISFSLEASLYPLDEAFLPLSVTVSIPENIEITGGLTTRLSRLTEEQLAVNELMNTNISNQSIIGTQEIGICLIG
ncbi:hypothetical protein ACQZV8_11895 [Magnetococcales bacterium HHB-1]